MISQGIGIVRSEPTHRIVAFGIAHYGQSLYGVPCRIGGEFQRETIRSDSNGRTICQSIHRKFLGFIGLHIQAHAFGNEHTVGKHGNGVLFAIAERCAFGNNTYAKNIDIGRYINYPRYGG
jgi:hypothetical protein